MFTIAKSPILTLLLLFLSLLSPTSSQPLPTINTTSGPLRGFSPFPNIIAYLGIPHAQPPLGALRFAPPVPYTTNDTLVRECYMSTPGCFQLNYQTAFADRSTGIAESEDMMSINIVYPCIFRKCEDIG
jgi:carboxylesterase type B